MQNIDFELKQERYNLTKTVEILFNKKTEERINVKVPYTTLVKQLQRFISVALKNRNKIISTISKTDTFDDYTIGHSVNVCMLSILIGDIMGFDENKLTEFAIAALLHDIGKRETPINILYKCGKLTDEEFAIMKKHPSSGRGFMERVYPEASDSVKAAILQHHERMDGSGYPKGIKWYDISDFARIIAVADVYEAFTSLRSYHDKRSIAEGITCIRETRGLDMNIVNLFTENSVFYPDGVYVVLSDSTVAVVDGNHAGETPSVYIPGKEEEIDIGDRVIVDILSAAVNNSA